jgi:hypothetical protein
MEILFAYLVFKGWVAIRCDAINAYAQTSIPKEEEQYIIMDQHMKEWRKYKYGTNIKVGMVRQILKALQGHPVQVSGGQKKSNNTYVILTSD